MEKAGFDEGAAVKAAGIEYLNVAMPVEIPAEAELAKIFAVFAASGRTPRLNEVIAKGRRHEKSKPRQAGLRKAGREVVG